MLRRALALFLTCACTTTTPSSGTCSVADASVCPNTPPSFTKDVLPVLDRACNSTCHAPGVGPWPLTNYDDVNDWRSILAADIEKCSMPPADASAGNGSLSDAERTMLLQWLAACQDDAGHAPNN